MSNWIVTLPRTVIWEDYKKELAAVAAGTQSMFYKLPYKPKGMQVGDRCYITWWNYVRGYMIIKDIARREFTCSTTGVQWSIGWYMERTGQFFYESGAYKKGFRGIRLYEPETEEEEIQNVETMEPAQTRSSTPEL